MPDQTIDALLKALGRIKPTLCWHIDQAREWTEEASGAVQREDYWAFLTADDLHRAHRAEAERLHAALAEGLAELDELLAQRQAGGHRG